MNNAEAEINKLNTELKQNNTSLNENKSSYDKLNDKITEQKSKLNELKVQYGSVVLEQGKNSKEAKALAGEIKTLSVNIKDNETKMKKSTRAIDEFTSSEKSAGNETLKFGDLIKANLTSETIIAGVKGLASAMEVIVNGIVNLGKEAIANYAEYEQLVGGVETLFKDNAGAVEDYANKHTKLLDYLQINTWKKLQVSLQVF